MVVGALCGVGVLMSCLLNLLRMLLTLIYLANRTNGFRSNSAWLHDLWCCFQEQPAQPETRDTVQEGLDEVSFDLEYES